MLQQDLLDTLFLNKKALAGEGGTTATATATTTTTTTSPTQTTTGGDNKNNDHARDKNSNITMKDTGADAAAAQCPVDHNSREAWLAQARAAQQSSQPPSAEPKQTPSSSSSSSSGGWGWRIPFLSSSSSSSTTIPSSTQENATTTSHHQQPPPPPKGNLGTDRVISSIPRSTGPGATTSACPVNHETETGADPKTGNWVYPSEKMFFDAMRRKGHATQAADMKTVVPIHNAVNERAWHEIREWERPYESASCPGGPRLYSFTGLSTTMSPKARLNTLLGYTAPFDRHDWVIDRCGTKVEYVIDFYAGKSSDTTTANNNNNRGGKPSFYLDVRPKLNSWEGWRMRATRILGLS